MAQVLSWGLMKGQDAAQTPIHWRSEIDAIWSHCTPPFLAYGYGRSYGDSCLPVGGTVLAMDTLRKIRWFDRERGVISCEAGLSFAELLDLIVPTGWFVPVTPGTKFVSLGGAMANDVHGKNHHRRGTIGCHIQEFELRRSNGDILHCSPTENSELFRATLGGLGLTGLISWCTLALIPIASALIDAESIKTKNLEEFFELEEDSQEKFEYTVSWIDCMARGRHRGRGNFIRGNHRSVGDPAAEYAQQSKLKVSIPIAAPEFVLNSWSIRAFNQLYYHKQQRSLIKAQQALDPFFYPLDMVLHWNRLYGNRGLLQYQCVLPVDRKAEFGQLFDRIAASGQGSFLAVIKKFGSRASPGLLSFPGEGYTLSLDFAFRGDASRKLFAELDRLVGIAGGRLYPAKDALMSPAMFQASYPQWREFQSYVDPAFQSLFWQRVSAHVPG